MKSRTPLPTLGKLFRNLYIFIDENQSIYRRHANLPVADAPYYLTANCRNTASIHEVGYVHHRGEPVDPPELESVQVEIRTVEDSHAQAREIFSRISEWLAVDGLDEQDIVVLVAKRPKEDAYALLRSHQLSAGLTWAPESLAARGRLRIDTVARFKDLEAQAVVLWLGEEVAHERRLETVYVGATRAKSLLCVVGSKVALFVLRAFPP